MAALVFLKAIDATRRGKGCREPGKERAWLYRIAHNLWCDHVRHLHSAATPATCDLDDAEDLAVYHEPGYLPTDPPLLARAQRQLIPTQAEVIALEIEGYTFAEIAARQGKTEGAVKTMRHRALVNLRRVMEVVAQA